MFMATALMAISPTTLQMAPGMSVGGVSEPKERRAEKSSACEGKPPAPIILLSTVLNRVTHSS